MDIAQINAELRIVRLNHQKFKGPFEGGYYSTVGYGLVHPELGYLAFNDGGYTPYRPAGGKEALEAILAGGGFSDYSDIRFLKEMESEEVQRMLGV